MFTVLLICLRIHLEAWQHLAMKSLQCHFVNLLVCVCVCVCKLLNVSLTLCDPMDIEVHGILQARIPESGVPFPSSKSSLRAVHKEMVVQLSYPGFLNMTSQ